MKKIIIATPSLNSGGVEVSLIRFLDELVKDKNLEITLLLLKKEGIYINKVPKEVKIVTVSYIDELYDFNNQIKNIINIKGIKKKIIFFIYRYKLRKYLKNNDLKSYYSLILSKTNQIASDYDLAIDWHGYGHFITTVIASLTKARKKATWIHDEKTDWLKNVSPWLDSFDKIFCVSNSCKKTLSKNNQIKDKLEVFYNMTDYQNVIKRSKEKINITFDKNKLNLVTIGRLAWQKGYDILIDTSLILKDKQISFCWYIIGDGPLKNELQKQVNEKKLSKQIKFLGLLENPYPYIKNADLYIQTSRHEGYGLAIEEARILKTVVIATNLNCIKEQIKDYQNGFLCKLNPNNFSKKIIEVSQNKELIQKIKNNLEKDSFDRKKEFIKLYKLLEEKK